MTEGQNEYAKSLVMPGNTPAHEPTVEELKVKAEKTAGFKSLGLSDGEADFAAEMKMPG